MGKGNNQKSNKEAKKPKKDKTKVSASSTDPFASKSGGNTAGSKKLK